MRRPLLPTLLVLVATIFSVLEHAHGAPVVNPIHLSSTVRPGDMKLDKPTQYHTVHTTQTALGPVTETCDIQLIPFKAEDGCDLVREDRKCLIEFVPNGVANSNNGNNSGNGNNGNNNTDSNGSSTDGSNTNSGQDGATIVSSGSIDASAASSAASTLSTDGSGATTATSTTSAALSTSTPSSGSGAVANDNTPTSTLASGNTSASVTSTNTAAPDTSPTNFQLPGTKLSVLPIGLGVFAGVSVIALIVVGLVTYERTKYRKAFRQRKLAEQGQAPGMSERPPTLA